MALSDFDPNIPTNIPRLPFASRIALTPFSDGFLVYQTDLQKGFYYYEAGKWFLLGSATSLGGSVRPLKPYLGQTFFDTTLGYRIDWNGTNWVNSDGAAV